MTFCSAAVGGMLALLHGPVDAVAWFACLVGLLLAHATNNQLNDFTDSALGIDTATTSAIATARTFSKTTC